MSTPLHYIEAQQLMRLIHCRAGNGHAGDVVSGSVFKIGVLAGFVPLVWRHISKTVF